MIFHYQKVLDMGNWINMAMLIVLSSCSSTQSIHSLPEDGPSTKSVYDEQMTGDNHAVDTIRQRTSSRYDLSVYTRDPSSELKQLFPRLPNPDIMLYVAPHLTEKKRPIPGYSTIFKLYDVDHYAMPGEIAR